MKIEEKFNDFISSTLEQHQEAEDYIDERAWICDEKSLVGVARHQAEDARWGRCAHEDGSDSEKNANLVVECEEDARNAEPDDGQNRIAENWCDRRNCDVILCLADCRAHQPH